MSEGTAAPGRRAGRRRWLRVVGVLLVALVVVAALLFWRSTIPSTPGAFFTLPDPLPAGLPGTLIRSEPITDGVPDGAIAHRILYHSTGIDGEAVAVSGIVVAPEAPPTGPRPVIAWANGSLGVRPECGTSHTSRPFGQIPELERLISEGYVVAATDYPGRGTSGAHPYLVGPVAAASVLDSVRAARQLDATAGERFAVWGRSQGGHSALWTAQLAGDYAPELELVGAAASAPAIDLPAILRGGMTTKGGAVVISQALYAWSQVYPEVDLDELIRPDLRSRFERLATTCLTTPTAFLTLGGIPTPAEFLAIDPLADPTLAAIVERNIPSDPIDVPILISHGTGDHLIDVSGSVAEAERRCVAGEQVLFMRYPGVEHDAADVSAVATIGWIEDAFADRPMGTSCGTTG